MVYTAILAQNFLLGSGDPLVRLPPSRGRRGFRHPDQPLLRRVFFPRSMGHPGWTWNADTSTWKSTTARCSRLLHSLLAFRAVYKDTRLLSRTPTMCLTTIICTRRSSVELISSNSDSPVAWAIADHYYHSPINTRQSSTSQQYDLPMEPYQHPRGSLTLSTGVPRGFALPVAPRSECRDLGWGAKSASGESEESVLEEAAASGDQFWAIRSTISTVDRTREIYLIELISYQRHKTMPGGIPRQ